MSDRAQEVSGRVVKHIEEIAEQRDSFDRVSAKLTEERFVAAWSRAGTPDEIDLKGSLERAYEQMINDLHGMLELVEGEAHRCGLIPDPSLAIRAGNNPGAWWAAATAVGVDISRSSQGQAPGRWRRLALYGYIEHRLATSLTAWSDSRDLLQHAYAQRTTARGEQVWAVMHSLRREVANGVDAITKLLDRCGDPPAAPAP